MIGTRKRPHAGGDLAVFETGAQNVLRKLLSCRWTDVKSPSVLPRPANSRRSPFMPSGHSSSTGSSAGLPRDPDRWNPTQARAPGKVLRLCRRPRRDGCDSGSRQCARRHRVQGVATLPCRTRPSQITLEERRTLIHNPRSGSVTSVTARADRRAMAWFSASMARRRCDTWHRSAFTSFGDGHGCGKGRWRDAAPRCQRNFGRPAVAMPIDPRFRRMPTVVASKRIISTPRHRGRNELPARAHPGLIQSRGLDLSRALIAGADRVGRPFKKARPYRSPAAPLATTTTRKPARRSFR
jgi:hypothetical protein